MVKKLSFTSSLELIPLMEVPGVKQVRRYLALVVNVPVDYLLVPILDPLELCFLRQLPVALCLTIHRVEDLMSFRLGPLPVIVLR